jgi:pseudaminic acid synthase
MKLGNRQIRQGKPVYIIAELSANHGQKFDQAGADAVKLQTYTPDTITMKSDREEFRIKRGTLWSGKDLYTLYSEAYMPWEWQPKLKSVAEDLGLDLFSTAFDTSAVDFLEEMKVPAYKIASFEIVDLPLIETVARTGKPLIVSTGMATLHEIREAISAARSAGASQIALLKCTSAYPAQPGEMNLRTIPHLAETFGVPVGLSDHTLGIAVPIAAVALGACIVEKHLTLSRKVSSPDAAFSLEPDEFKQLVEAIRTAEESLGKVHYGVSGQEIKSRTFRRSLFAVKDIKKAEVFTVENVRSIRPGNGLAPKYLKQILGKRACREIKVGTPLSWKQVGKG